MVFGSGSQAEWKFLGSPPIAGLVVLVVMTEGMSQASVVHRFVCMLLPGLNTMEALQSDSRIQPIQRLPHITHCKTEKKVIEVLMQGSI